MPFLSCLDRGVPLDAWLEDHVALSCGSPACAPPPGRAELRVGSARCDVCGGRDLPAAIRRFEDALLLRGLRRVAVLGGAPRAQRQLRALVADPRIELRFIPGDRPRLARDVARDEAAVDVVLAWRGPCLAPGLAGAYGLGPVRRIDAEERAVSAFLSAAAEGLSGD
jgi:hypothetical protein